MSKQNKNLPLPDRDQMEKIYLQLLPSFEKDLLAIYQKIRSLIDKHGMAVTIKYRVKRLDNYCEKLRRISRVQGSDLLQITDLLGIRIICPFLEDLETVEQLISANFDILEMEHKAEQHSFREFGYDSVHLLIRTSDSTAGTKLPHSSPACEVQLRTILQEAWAEVEHELVYKSDIAIPNLSIRRKLASLNASLTLSDLIFQEIRDNQKEIRQRGLKRRQTVETPACNCCSSRDISKLPEVSVEEMLPDLDISVAMPQKKLEQLMLSALDAHSNHSFEQAIKLYSLILKMKLETKIRSLVYNHRGMAWFTLAEYHKGIDDFNKAIEHDEYNARAWNNCGLALRVLGRYEQSLSCYDRTIAMAPRQYEGFWGRAQTYFEMKLYSQALKDCFKVCALNHDFQPAVELKKVIHQQLF
jgi:putative GTP pyrophosphokinase